MVFPQVADMFNILAQKATAAKKGAKPVSEVTTDIHNFFQSKQYMAIENNIHPCKKSETECMVRKE
jgi:hypothetical protein